MTRMTTKTDFIEYMLLPGQIYFSRQPSLISTVLGSCVAVCLWDPKKKIGGMSHYLYPVTKIKEEATARYGNVSLRCLMHLFLEQGVKKKICRPSSSAAPPPKTLYARRSPGKTSPWPEDRSRSTASGSSPRIPAGIWDARSFTTA